jgi:dihydrosphingosine 1-phosphate phosphatase
VGSHVFYMLWLPMLFWCGQAQYGRHLTMLLALALWACNFIKDGLCLPRPTSPPVAKLSSQLYVIEYGFPSAHAMNSVLMAGFSAVYCVYHAYADAPLAPLAAAGVWAAAATFIVAISFSRLYCGMHTATDLVGGLLLGALLLALWLSNYATIEAWLTSSPYGTCGARPHTYTHSLSHTHKGKSIHTHTGTHTHIHRHDVPVSDWGLAQCCR